MVRCAAGYKSQAFVAPYDFCVYVCCFLFMVCYRGHSCQEPVKICLPRPLCVWQLTMSDSVQVDYAICEMLMFLRTQASRYMLFGHREF